MDAGIAAALLSILSSIQGLFTYVSDSLDNMKAQTILDKKSLPVGSAERQLASQDLRALNESRFNVASRIADSPVTRVAGRYMIGIGAGLSAWSEYDTARDNGHSVLDSSVRAGAAGVADTPVGMGAVWAGTAVGAAIGTAILPVGGTLVGGAIGGLVGAVASIPATNVVNNIINWF